MPESQIPEGDENCRNIKCSEILTNLDQNYRRAYGQSMGEMVNVYEAKTQLSKLLARVEAGEEITLSRHGQPVARLVPLPKPSHRREPGALKGKIWIAPDFDAFTPQDDRDWYGE